MFENIQIDIEVPMATIRINRPDKLNALNRQTLQELDQALNTVEKESAVRMVVITGAGEKAFVAGADIAEINALDRETGQKFALAGQKIFTRIENFPKPVIAAVNGYALGGGCELAMACHIRIAARNARFGQPEVALGLIPGFGGTQRLARLTGRGVAIELCATGMIIDAEHALRIGLVNRVVPLTELQTECTNLAVMIADKAPLAVSAAIRTINQGLDLELEPALQLEAEQFAALCATEDMQEGTEAFLNKRKSDFKGR